MTASGGTEPAAAPPAPSACLSFKPIYWSVADTDGTVEQAKAHNAVGRALCGWGTDPLH